MLPAATPPPGGLVSALARCSGPSQGTRARRKWLTIRFPAGFLRSDSVPRTLSCWPWEATRVTALLTRRSGLHQPKPAADTFSHLRVAPKCRSTRGWSGRPRPAFLAVLLHFQPAAASRAAAGFGSQLRSLKGMRDPSRALSTSAVAFLPPGSFGFFGFLFFKLKAREEKIGTRTCLGTASAPRLSRLQALSV